MQKSPSDAADGLGAVNPVNDTDLLESKATMLAASSEDKRINLESVSSQINLDDLGASD